MSDFNILTEDYLQHCLIRKRLNPKTVRAYRTNLKHFSNYLDSECNDFLDKTCVGRYIDSLHRTHAPRTAKHKIATLQAFYHNLVMRNKIYPRKWTSRFRDPLFFGH